jgi:hypothetical protein
MEDEMLMECMKHEIKWLVAYGIIRIEIDASKIA